MRNLMFAAAFAMALSTGAMSAQAQIKAMPSGLKMSGPVIVDDSGKPIYTFDNDTMKGMSHCTGGCATAWPPVKADDKAKAVGDFTIINRDDGSKQWAYKDKPLYTFAKDTAGQPAMGEGAGKPWKLAKMP
jgi:predicted lipoprotein with Yx(FWY)xxD motif